MKLSDYDYTLPRELVAAYPPEDRASARLLRVDRSTGAFSHHTFRDVLEFLRPGDLLVLNNTKVLPARVFGKRETGGKIEALFLKECEDGTWKALIRPGGRVKKNALLFLGDNGQPVEARVMDDPKPDSGERRVAFSSGTGREVLAKIGHIPLPPYIDRPDTPIDRTLYQTVFAEKEGAVAAPTAGLHFDRGLLEALEKKGVETAYVTLHTGYGTFQPLVHEEVEKNELFTEEYEVTDEAAARINAALKQGRRIIACGTTTVRTLESCADEGGVRAGRGNTGIFIYEPYKFRVVSGLITNFHLPKSSLMLLVAAFLGGREKLINAYEEAVREKYKFYSYGDAMVIL
jgi:S-adenosylmethionine:tRNA ribosyltransferase-isomerase